ncbi:MAG: hypothetical protein M3N49_00450 [Candidatus Eremiobacteraeota bacterium]|nr:hypothetical protein [Candidatus Eremiobacteraeota bacterium]
MVKHDRYDAFIHGEDFNRAVFADDDLTAVLRAHVHFEHHIESLLLAAIPNSEPLLNELMFLRKLNIAKKLGVIDGPFFKAVNKFNEIRNQFAHGFERRTLTAQDDGNLSRTLSAELIVDGDISGQELFAHLESQWMQQQKSKRTPPAGVRSRLFMMALQTLLLALVVEVQQGRRAPTPPRGTARVSHTDAHSALGPTSPDR